MNLYCFLKWPLLFHEHRHAAIWSLIICHPWPMWCSRSVAVHGFSLIASIARCLMVREMSILVSCHFTCCSLTVDPKCQLWTKWMPNPFQFPFRNCGWLRYICHPNEFGFYLWSQIGTQVNFACPNEIYLCVCCTLVLWLHGVVCIVHGTYLWLWEGRWRPSCSLPFWSIG